MINVPTPYFDEHAYKAGLLQYHVKLKAGDIGRYVLMCSDPKSSTTIARHLDKAELIADNREYVSYTGQLDGARVSVVSHGMGGPSTAIALEELIKLGGDTFISIGYSETLQRDPRYGKVLMARGAIRAEGCSYNYIPEEYPAVPDYAMFRLLCRSAEKLRIEFDTGLFYCSDSYYPSRIPKIAAVSETRTHVQNAYHECEIVCSDMESATFFAVASAHRVRAACLCLITDSHTKHSNRSTHPAESEIQVAIEAVKMLIAKEPVD